MHIREIAKEITICLLLFTVLHAGETEKERLKRELLANRTLTYHKIPPNVENLVAFLREGVWYGRLRLNSFRWNWREQTADRKDNEAIGIGGSVMFKSAYYHGVGVAIDAYTSQNPWHMEKEDVPFLKAGKDTLSRYDVYEKDSFQMNVVAQLYMEYKIGKSSFKYGRQKFESLLIKSNDTKMIPNTFEGLSLCVKDLPKHTFKLAWLTKQKLRDHTHFHDVITFKDANGNQWGNNDDSGGHKGLSYENFIAAGKDPDHDLLVAEVVSLAVKDLKATLDYTAVPDLLYDVVGEAHYRFKVGWLDVVPGMRYMIQCDDGGGSIGGASATGIYVKNGASAVGYHNPQSLNSWLAAVRVDFKSDLPWKLRLAYSQVADKADIVAPWRGFPTGGFTRAMGQYNWYANTKTTMIRGDWDFQKADMIHGLKAMFRLAYEDYDDAKIGTIGTKRFYLQPTDRTVLHLDAIYKVPTLDGLEARVRMAFVDAQKDLDGSDPSYREYRFEMNYLF